jgi:hypothetical protein
MDQVIHQLRQLHGRMLEITRELETMERQLHKVIDEALHLTTQSMPGTNLGAKGEPIGRRPGGRTGHVSYGSQYANQVTHAGQGTVMSDMDDPRVAVADSYGSLAFGTRGVQTSYENNMTSGAGVVGRQSEYTTYGRQR